MKLEFASGCGDFEYDVLVSYTNKLASLINDGYKIVTSNVYTTHSYGNVYFRYVIVYEAKE